MPDGSTFLGDTGWDERDAAGFLPHLIHVADGAVLLDDGAVMGTLRLDGAPWHLEDVASRNRRLILRNAMLRTLGGDGIEICENFVRHEVPTPAAPSRFAPRSYASALDRDYRGKALGRMFANEWFSSVVVRPPTPAAKLSSLFRRKAKGEPTADVELLRVLDDRLSVAEESLAAYGPTRLGLRERPEDGALFSEIAEALRLILYARHEPVGLTSGPLGYAVYNTRAVFGRRPGFEVIHGIRSTYGVLFGFGEYPSKTWPGMLNALLDLSHSLVITNSFRFMTRAYAKEAMALKQRQMANAGDDAVSQIEELAEARDDMASGRKVPGSHHFSVAVHADSILELERATSSVRAILADAGANPIVEDRGQQAAFFAQLPGARARWRTRPGRINSRNFAGLSSCDGFLHGQERGHWGAPPFVMQTTAGTEYRFHLHDDDVGHNLLIGPSGSGKTAFIGFALTMLDPHVGGHGGIQVLFDKDAGNEIAVRANGGSYTTLTRDAAGSGAAPLKAMPDSPDTRAWLCNFVAAAVLSDGLGPISADDWTRIARGVAFVMRMPPALRAFAGVRQFMGHGEGGAGERFQRWCRGGPLGWAFDGEADTIDLARGIAAVDPTALLADETVMPLMASYLMHRVKRLMDGRRMVVWMDEARAYLPPTKPDHPLVRDTEDFLLTGRKFGLAMVLATQQPEHILDHPIGPSVVAQCRQRILFRNPDAKEGPYRDGLGCTAGEFRAVSEDMLVGPRSLLVKRHVGSVLCRFDLSDLPEHIAVLSARPGEKGTVGLMRHVMAEMGTDDPAVWVPEFQRRVLETRR
jgi:type IV secretion system protein VirB4